MIRLIDIPVLGKNYTKSAWEFSEAGDVLIIETQQPIIGITNLTGYSLITEGENQTNYLYVEHSVSLDGINWSEWYNDSLQRFNNSIKKNHTFLIKYKLEKKGTLPVKFYEVKLEFAYEIPLEPLFWKDHYYNKFFSYYNNQSIKWTLNVLEKVYRRGIVPKFINRDKNLNWSDEDYLNIWWCIIYFTALRVTYNDIFTNLPQYTYLFKKYLEQRGLFFGSKGNLDELYYFMDHFYDEIIKRGSLAIFDEKRDLPTEFQTITARGELLRLIDFELDDEFVAGLVNSEDQGWIVGYTSPLYINTDFYKNFIKAYENTESVLDLSKYPLIQPATTLQNIVVNSRNIKAMSITPGLGGGIGVWDFGKAINVSPNLNYMISFKLRAISNLPGAHSLNMHFGCSAFTSNLASDIKLKSHRNGIERDFFVNEFIPIADGAFTYDTFAYGIIFAKNTQLDSNHFSNFSRSVNFDHLQFSNDSISKIIPYIEVGVGNTVMTNIYLYDIKVSLLEFPDGLYISSRRDLDLFMKNNNPNYTEDELKLIIQNYLIPNSVSLNLNLI